MWFAIGLGIVAILIIIYFVIYSMCTTIVNDYSVLLQRIKRINRRYEFNDVDIIKLEVNYDNEDYYENVSTQDYLIYQLQYIQDEVKENIDLFLENSNQYELYMSEINERYCKHEYNIKIPFLLRKLIYSIETKKVEECVMLPNTEFSVFVKIRLTDLRGNVFKYKTKYFNMEEVENLIERVNDKTNHRFNDKAIWDSISSVERAKVTNKLRLAIYERDDYCCVKCGSEIDLEIDHIIPISKGGKSEPSNLQTLCRSCNKQKSNIIEPYNEDTYNSSVKYCPRCKAPLKVIDGKYGKFYGCSNYPRCDYTRRY